MTRIAAFSIAGLVVLADRLSKVWIERNVSMWDSHTVIPNVFNIVYTRNSGAAFGILHDAPDWLRATVLIGVSTIVMSIILWLIWKDVQGRFPLALLAGGAIGNLYDRIIHGSVTDFLQVFIGSYEWPSFNVADSAITIGAILMALDMFRKRTPAHAPQAH